MLLVGGRPTACRIPAAGYGFASAGPGVKQLKVIKTSGERRTEAAAEPPIRRGRGTIQACALALFVASIPAGGCGGGGGNNAPTPSVSRIDTPDGLTDVGLQVLLDGRSSFDPTDQGLRYFWTLIRPSGSDAAYQDHCAEPSLDGCTGDPISDCDIPNVCTTNDDKTCVVDDEQICETNADCSCPESDPDCGLLGGDCDPVSGTVSAECPTGRCDVDEGRAMDFATFIADLPGPYTVRLLTQATNNANDVATRVIRTNPSLFLVGSLIEFGGTQGNLVGVSPDAEIFAPNATAGAANPITGNLVVAVPSPPVIREFDFRTRTVVGAFGETSIFPEVAVALAFDERVLWVAYASGIVRRFDAATGLFIDAFGDVTGPGQSVSAIAVAPQQGNLFVADATPGNGVREYQRLTAAESAFGETALAVNEATDLVFRGDPVFDVLITDGTGDVIQCNPAGLACTPFGAAAASLVGSAPSAIALNPSIVAGDAAVLVSTSEGSGGRVIACTDDGSSCSDFGDTGAVIGGFFDIVFAPTEGPTTTTSSLFPVSTSTTVSTSSSTSSTSVTTMADTSTTTVTIPAP